MEVPEARLQVETLARNAKTHNIPYLGLQSRSQGIVHVIGPELSFTLPGTTVVCGDSHTSTHGALGCLAFGIGTSEVEHVLATQTITTTKWKNLRIWVEGAFAEGVRSKDLSLYIIGQIGTAAGTGAVIEFAGPVVESMTMEARMSLCNMAIETGARAGIIAPDEVTFKYVKGRPLAPENASWEDAVLYFKSLKTEPGAIFDGDFRIDAKDVSPTVTWGTSPEQITPITGFVPHPEDFSDPSKVESCLQALHYMGLEPGTKMTDIKVDKIFIGSCTNARLSDLRSAASILRGRKISPTLKGAYVVPGSGLVKQQAESEGLDQVFKVAGFEWREAGCSLCVGLNEDQLEAYERSASSSNRNFENRQGTAGRTHLMSPAMAAATAIEGKLSDVRNFLPTEYGLINSLPSHPEYVDIKESEEEDSYEVSQKINTSQTIEDDDITAGPFTSVSSIIAPIHRANVDTDCILPKQFCTTILRRGLGDALSYNLRRHSDGKPEESFILNQAPYNKTRILLCTGSNFGCGSSREHAVWALLDFGIRVVLAPSFADIFFNNSFKNGLLPASVNEKNIAILQKEAEAGRTITVILSSQQILDQNGKEIAMFTVDPRLKRALLEDLDEIGLSLKLNEHISLYEARKMEKWPWLDTCLADGWKR
ncbi:3-isopropylmalate dehydratase [Conoideocrella luteorostrata]|uniref:3-isopropylmalate dehydratase n=1 Tax=Conoideocrella luteorostrata TaxID=1105319 RepID=A0AAJ0CHN2_9HYPO|nr:3-isopropylmalate dehydratase [Conoideocrella luteorostrata]